MTPINKFYRNQLIAKIPSVRPVDGGYLNSSYVYRIDPIDNVRRFHQGQDITIPI